MSIYAARRPTDALPPGEAELDALGTLHTRIVDIGAGFETMLDKAEPGFRPVVERFVALHRGQAAAVAELIGHGPDAAGGESLMATVNRTVVSLRSFFDEIDADTLGQIRSGEEHVFDAYDAAIAAATGARGQALARLRGELSALIEDTRRQG
ncbi:PA2169 family four-helix-bundle protein [Rhodobacter sp. Har01]|uniref:DUF2383 domain-containing protein n=1 Tax=Rhodobacter sp. Har01 TaxID=2883999 RepID=UPI001D06FC85|nr:DUF2383 domain-containing protein [Rhodobacter sp. Har01]MCB6176582.1 PA2169 family four-helix-bundle protein [Rhodobacter sp. Har01]